MGYAQQQIFIVIVKACIVAPLEPMALKAAIFWDEQHLCHNKYAVCIIKYKVGYFWAKKNQQFYEIECAHEEKS